MPVKVWSNDSLTAWAAYADLVQGDIDSAGVNRDALIAKNWAQPQIELFSNIYSNVIQRYTDEESDQDAGDDTGFSVTVFADGPAESATKVSIAFRGTQLLPTTDFFPTDADIFFEGAGYDQIVAMYNWWQRETNATGVPVSQFDVKSLLTGTQPEGSVLLESNGLESRYLVPIADSQATGDLHFLSGLPPESISVSGHSLGGHLALAFNGLFFGVSSYINTYNAPGFLDSNTNQNFFAALGGMVPGFLHGTTLNVTNLQGTEVGLGAPGFLSIAGRYFESNSQGSVIEIPIENQINVSEPDQDVATLNHSIQQLTDALAVFDVFAALDQSLTESGFDTFFTLSSNREFTSHEDLVNALIRLFQVKDDNQNFLDPVPGGNATENRKLLYDAIRQIAKNENFIAVAGNSFTFKDLDGIGAIAVTDFGAFLTVQLLLPFAFSADEGILSSLFSDIHSQWSAGEFSSEYIADRARIFEAISARNTDDLIIIGPINGESIVFEDADIGIIAAVQPGTLDYSQVVFGNSADNLSLRGGLFDDRLYGLDGTDFLDGRAGDDLLEGGRGDDFLTGGEGEDTLRGGTGFDQYLAGPGDVITDSDNLGAVHFNESYLTGGIRNDDDPEGQYLSSDGKFTYQLLETTLTIIENTTGDFLTIEDFDINSNSLNITLKSETELSELPVITGTESDNTLSGTLGGDEIHGLGGDDDIIGDAGDDLLFGEDGNDVILANGGNDELDGGSGIDILRGDEGDDFITGGADGDLLLGGGGVDTLVGGDGSDVLMGDAATISDPQRGDSFEILNPGTVNTLVNFTGFSTDVVDAADQPAGAGPGDQLFGGAGDDVLSGGVGDDYLSGDAGNDVILAGSHNDFVSGGTGADVIYGDETLGVPSVVPGHDIILGGDGNDFIIAGLGDDFVFGGNDDDEIYGDNLTGTDGGNDFISGDDGNDLIRGGAGDDRILGGAGMDDLKGELGNDLIFGGEDDDLIDGGDGDDELDGGDGNDTLLGGIGNDILRGGEGDDFLDGGDGDDIIVGGPGIDTITGGEGNDTLESGVGDSILDGGNGNDAYLITDGAGTVEITQSSGNDTLRFSGSYGANDLTINRQNGTLMVSVAGTAVSYQGWNDGATTSLQLSQTISLSNADLELLINDAPEVVGTIQNQIADVGSQFAIQVPDGIFVDSDDETLTYAAVLSDDQPLPTWLAFNSETQELLGTPGAGDAGLLSLKFIATDANGLSVETDFSLLVRVAPQLVGSLSDETVEVGYELFHELPSDSFANAGLSGNVTYQATLTNGLPLPSWLTFDTESLTFGGVPLEEDIGRLFVTVTATDAANNSAVDEFELRVEAFVDTQLVPTIDAGYISFLGAGVANIGDINGDGFSDLYLASMQREGDSDRPQEYFFFNGKEEEFGISVADQGWLSETIGGSVFEQTRTVPFEIGNEPRAISLGDFNGDGIDDIGIYSPQTFRGSIVFGADPDFYDLNLNLDNLEGHFDEEYGGETPARGIYIELTPANQSDQRWIELKAVGDIDADGYTDFIYGFDVDIFSSTDNSLTTQLDQVESSMLVFGGPETSLDLLRTVNSGARTLNANGDFNGDGRADPIFVTSDFNAYIVFDEIVDFESIPTIAELSDVASAQFSPGSTYYNIDYIGDFNGDGNDDVVVTLLSDINYGSSSGNDVGSQRAADLGYAFASRAYVIFGNEDAATLPDIDLNSLDGTNGFVLDTPFRSINSGGDVDGDGLADLVLIDNTSSASLIFGNEDGFSGSFQLSDIDGSTGFNLSAPATYSAAILSDANADGFSDIVLGAPRQQEESGQAFTILGQDFRNKAAFVGSGADDTVTVNSDGAIVFGLGGNDTFNVVSGSNIVISTGAGDNIVNITEANSVEVKGGPGSNKFNVDLGDNLNSPLSFFKHGFTSGSGPNEYDLRGSRLGSMSLSGASSGDNSLSLDRSLGSIALGQGSLKITVNGAGYDIHLEDFDPNDVLGGPRNIDVFKFTDVELTYEELVALGFDINGTDADDILNGTNLVDRLDGLAGDDQILAGDGDDTLTGGTGDDTLNGGAGNDSYVINIGDGVDQIIDNLGTDVVQFGAGILPASLSVEQEDDDLVIKTSANDRVIIRNWFIDPEHQVEQFTFADDTNLSLSNSDIEDLIGGSQELNLIVGTAGGNLLTGTEAADQIEGLEGNDNISGSGGNDVIVGGPGLDTMSGGAGDDTFLISGSDTSPDNINGGDGIDTILGGDDDDTFRFHNFSGANTVEIIDGGLGDNVIAGTNGSNLIDLSGTVLIGIGRIEGLEGNDSITGSEAADLIIGGAGLDTLKGGGGDDTFLIYGMDVSVDSIGGGDGIDTILGGDDDDVFRFHNFSAANTVEIIDGGLGDNVIAGNNGSNLIDLSGTVLIGISRIEGLEGNDNITGSEAADLIIGGAGLDTLKGGGGDDTFLIYGTDASVDSIGGGDGVDTILGGDDDDTFRFHNFSAANTVEIIDGGLGDNVIAGNDGFNLIDLSDTVLIGISRIEGLEGNDNITGSAQGDVIQGGVGNDSLSGGTGDDVYLISAGDGNDTITESGSASDNDILRYQGNINFENLWFTKAGQNLVIAQVGSDDQVTIKNWFASDGNKIETIETADARLSSTDVDDLVEAMSGVVAPIGISGAYSQELQDTLFPIIHNNWMLIV